MQVQASIDETTVHARSEHARQPSQAVTTAGDDPQLTVLKSAEGAINSGSALGKMDRQGECSH